MKILPINTRFETQAKIKFDNQNKNQAEVDYSQVNNNNLNYFYNNIAFSSNLQTLEKMSKLTASKNYKFEDLEVYYSNTDKEYREILLKQHNLYKDIVSDLVRTSYACGIWDTNKIFLNKSGLSINKQKEILCHELVHKYQQSNHDKEYVIKNRSKIESEAEKSASKIISKYK